MKKEKKVSTLKNHPKTSMGSKRAIEVAICYWVDLLGYGSMLKDVEFNPLSDNAQISVNRLKSFHDIIRQSSKAKVFNSLALNDGAIFYRDLSPRAKSVTFDFLNRAYKVHEQINKREQELGLPGCRSVVAVGFRIRDKNYTKDDLRSGIGQYLIEQVKSNTISFEEAILKALAIKPCYDVVPDLQANFAFTKAYLADNEGSEGGFGGSSFFIDSSIFGDALPNFIKVSDDKPQLNIKGLDQPFFKVLEFENFKINHINKELLDAFEIAEKLTNDSNVNLKLKKFVWKPN